MKNYFLLIFFITSTIFGFSQTKKVQSSTKSKKGNTTNLYSQCKWCNKRLEYFNNPTPGYKIENFGEVKYTVSMREYLTFAVENYGWTEQDIKENIMGVIAVIKPDFCSENCAYKYKKVRE
jgi:hypothetical protein